MPPSSTFKKVLTCTDDIVPNYEVMDGGKSIRFTPCGVESFNLNDVRNFYCARCHRFLNDPKWLRLRTGKTYEQQ